MELLNNNSITREMEVELNLGNEETRKGMDFKIVDGWKQDYKLIEGNVVTNGTPHLPQVWIKQVRKKSILLEILNFDTKERSVQRKTDGDRGEYINFSAYENHLEDKNWRFIYYCNEDKPLKK